MIIDITLNDYKEIIASSKIIGKTYENKATILKFKLTDAAASKNFYLDIEKPDGTKFTTSQLNVVNNIVEYEVDNNILSIDGFLKIEVILTGDNNYQLKYPALPFKVESSINATDILPSENPTLIGQIQEVINLIDTTGDGTQYLSNDGTYKAVSGGASDYDVLDNKPIIILTGTNEEPIYLNTLETGLYLINGIYKPYFDATVTGTANNIFLQVYKGTTNINVVYDDLLNSEIDYLTIAIDGSSYTSKSYNLFNLTPKENITTSARTTISTKLSDNSSYQVSSIPTRILLTFDSEREVGYKSSFVFKTGDTIPQFICSYEIKWHGDSVTDNVFTINPNKSYTLDFWQDVNNFNCNVREV